MKRGLTPGILVGVIAVVAALTVTLIMVVPKLTDVLFTSGEQSQCQFNLLLSKSAETVTYGFGEEVPVDCKTTRKTITQNDLARYTALASQAIPKYPSDSEVAKIFSDTQEGRDKWALANIVANDMKSCYDRGWRGQLNIGENTVLKNIFGGLGGDEYLCILCTRYTFDQYVSSIDSFEIKPWLEKNVVQDNTFYGYLTNNDDKWIGSVVDKIVVDSSEPQTVIFIADSKGQGSIYVSPYRKITDDLGIGVRVHGSADSQQYIGVTRVWGPKDALNPGEFYRPSKCKYIIGD
jgi:hypothetical protein